MAPDAADAALVAVESAVEVLAEPEEPTEVAFESAIDVLRLTIEPI